MKRFTGILGLVVLAAVIVTPLVWLGYSQDWTGFQAYVDSTGTYHPAKTLWDWLDLFIIPGVLAIGVWWLVKTIRSVEGETAQQRVAAERTIAEERDRESALQTYLDRITELMLHRDLHSSKALQEIARARTLTALRVLDKQR
jgi:hypothetical protein